nr:MAG: ORF1 [TTV-like mini virus]
MPLYWRRPTYRYRYKRRWRRRRRPLFTRRFRKTIRGRYRRQPRVRRFRYYHRKAKKITVKQWNPNKILKCRIKGTLALFICGRTRINHDFTLYKESTSPAGEATGGGWSIQQITLQALFQEYIKHKNFWTKSNKGLPLTRYYGATLKFYKSLHTSYIVTISTCPPFSVTMDMFLNTQPQRQLMERKRIIVPKLKSGTRKKYKKIRIHPPSFMQNKWYFQQDICQTPLVLITTTACSLEQPYIPDDQVSNQITLKSLNTNIFQNPNFETLLDQNHGYITKHVGTQSMRLFGQKKTHGGAKPTKWSEVIPLTNTTNYESEGNITDITTFNKKENWGNPFSLPWSHPDQQIYYSFNWPNQGQYEETTTFTEIEELYTTCRYNPDVDKGTGNKVFLKSNNHDTHGTIGTLPQDPKHLIEDFPLWLIFWGWTDWILKSAAAQQLDSGYFIVVISPYIKPKRDYYVFLDRYFTDLDYSRLNLRDHLKWHPKQEMQTEVEYFFAQTGPYAPKINTSQSIQANMFYDFRFKWGGCPAPMADITNPCDQDRFPIPNSGLQPYEIENPQTKKESYLYAWDERRNQITKKCAKRIAENSDANISFTDFCPFDLPIQTSQKESDQETTSEEIKETYQQQLKQLKHQQRLLRHQLLRLGKRQKLE